jgi:prepilin-type N-terminal cleavage/methylation domain-containing protein
MTEQKNAKRSRLGGDSGVTLIEVIAVLVVMAIIMAVALSRGIGTDTANVLAEVNTLKSHLRYAQYLAMNDIPPNTWGIRIDGSSYTLFRDEGGTLTSPHRLPNDFSATHNFASGITASVAGANPILFDEWGSPVTSPTSISISGQTITITANTGFIP